MIFYLDLYLLTQPFMNVVTQPNMKIISPPAFSLCLLPSFQDPAITGSKTWEREAPPQLIVNVIISASIPILELLPGLIA